MKSPVVYILCSKKNGSLYVGVTSNLELRMHQHKSGSYQGHTKRYKIDKLVYYEVGVSMDDAIAREKYIKGKKRDYKVALIENDNPLWNDICNEWDGFDKYWDNKEYS